MRAETVCCRDVAVRHQPDAPPTLRGLSFTVGEGERVAVVGLNGAGKTSLLLALVGLAPHDGEVTICGHRLGPRTLQEVRRRVGFLFNVPEDQLLFPTVVDDVAFGLVRGSCGAARAEARAREALHDLGVGRLADQPVHHLSHGQKQRVALAGALVTGPPLLLLDEPTAGLDPPGRRDLARLLFTLPSAQIIATHDLELVDRVCTRVLLLEGGVLAADSPDTTSVRARWDLPTPS